MIGRINQDNWKLRSETVAADALDVWLNNNEHRIINILQVLPLNVETHLGWDPSVIVIYREKTSGE